MLRPTSSCKAANQPRNAGTRPGRAVVRLALVLALILPWRSASAEDGTYFRPFEVDGADGRWRTSAYAGMLVRNDVSDILLRGNPGVDRFGLIGIGVGREIGATLGGALRMEWEAGLAMRTERIPLADVRLMLGGRWMAFPWNRHVRTTAAFLIGPSWLSGTSRYEDESGRARPWSLGFAMEVTLAPPSWEQVSFLFRLQHRSFVWGLLGKGATPSDALGTGLRLNF